MPDSPLFSFLDSSNAASFSGRGVFFLFFSGDLEEVKGGNVSVDNQTEQHA
jgi:hypothetical protein